MKIVKLKNRNPKIKQSFNIENLLKRFGFDNSKFKDTPIEKNWNSKEVSCGDTNWDQQNCSKTSSLFSHIM